MMFAQNVWQLESSVSLLEFVWLFWHIFAQGIWQDFDLHTYVGSELKQRSLQGRKLFAPMRFISLKFQLWTSRVLPCFLQISWLESNYFYSIFCLRHWSILHVVFHLIWTRKPYEFWRKIQDIFAGNLTA